MSIRSAAADVLSEKPDFLTLKSVAARVSVSVKTIKRMIDRGDFPKPVKIGGKQFVVAVDYERWVQRAMRINGGT